MITNQVYDSVIQSCSNVALLDPEKSLCNKDKCFGDYKGNPLYFDSNHLSTAGANKLSLIIDKTLKEIK